MSRHERITPELTKAYAVNRAAITAATLAATAREVEQDTAAKLAPFHAKRRADAEQRFADAKTAARVLTNEQRIALCMYLIDNLDGVDDDARNAAVDAMGELL